MASIISMKALLESGVHFGHRTNKWDPRMKPYIFTERNGIHIIDLQQTVKSLNTAYTLVRDAVMAGGNIMFVGTKRQAQETIRDEAIRCGMPYVTERWLGGMLTNWTTIYQRIQELERLEKMRDSGDINRIIKKERIMIEREIKRLELRLSGVRNMKTIPNLLFVVDIGREATCIHEANLKNIPVIALVDTNCDPSGIDYVIPSNDDAIRAIKLLVGKMADAVLEGIGMRKDDVIEELSAESVRGQVSVTRRPMVYRDEELEDVDLLGESTLAKLSRPGEEAAEEVGETGEVKAEEAAVEEEAKSAGDVTASDEA
ncbi:MAG: 30S ribosomal protein S2 [Anaerolineaceae bacterium]|nr:30S ribosomal protein S2 [Anaerolineaceae bacterium]